MTQIERVRAICKEKHIPISRLEKDLGFSNGYLNPKKAESISYLRIMAIANYLGVSVFDITGEEIKIPRVEGTLTFTKSKSTKKKEKPATDAGDGWKDAVRALPPDLLGLLSDFVQLAKEDPETARRYLAFAVQELQSRQ